MKTVPNSDLKPLVHSLARELGFDEVGVTKPAALEEGEEAIEEWVSQGRHGGMKYLEDFRARRERFFKEIPDAKSVIVLGVNYYSKENSKTSGGQVKMKPVPPRFQGRVARYAWGKDYHEVIRQKHEVLIARLTEILNENFSAKSCVDIQPIPERFAAVQAGFGFLGKHTGLLHKQFGPWLFLSEIVTNLHLEEDKPTGGDCGTCNHCQTVCPTGALDEDYKIDARRCIAYLTIEHKGVIARELRPQIKDWIFGCDECLNICPFTSKSQETRWKEFQPEAGFGEWLPIEELFAVSSNTQHEKKFSGTALLRTSRKQLLRNACLVLGNSGREDAIPYLQKALDDPSSLVRLHAAWGLGELRFESARQTLKRHLAQETDPDVCAEIKMAIQTLNGDLKN